ncbi:MAG: adenylate/guanylate cyclase domain-containing protein [Verrucomicrobia bacterium]|nr:adenylate/guanylate cyclase domain-containing protein [Verrucomicrobiota bacterium]
MVPSRRKLIPAGIALVVLALVCAVRLLPAKWDFSLFERLELMTFDWRARIALKESLRHLDGGATNEIGVVLVDDSTLRKLNERDARYFWPLPRKLHGQLVHELTAQGAEAVLFDMSFIDLQPDYAETREKIPGKGEMSSDEAFAWQMAQAGSVVLYLPGDRRAQGQVPDLFRTNAAAVGHASKFKDPDDIFRRVPLFFDHPVNGRVWAMSIVAAARHLRLDLDKAVVERNRVILRGPGGVERVIPTDSRGNMFVDWVLPINHPGLQQEQYLRLIEENDLRIKKGAPVRPQWQNKLVFIGSVATGNNVSDRGPTAISAMGTVYNFLTAAVWNTANSILVNRFIHPPSLALELGLIALLTGIAALVSWRLQAVWASVGIVAVAAAYTGLCVWLYVRYRWWLPLVLPVGGALLMTHLSMVSYRVLVEQRQRRSLRRFVSPNVMELLLRDESLPLGGTRRLVTVFFADLRGFTEFTDTAHAIAVEDVRRRKLDAATTQHALDGAAQETMNTVNLYLAAIVDAVKTYDGTLDKYIGDCVMAFWGAPVDDKRQTLNAVRAAIAAQRAVHKLNAKRRVENESLESTNTTRLARNEAPLPPLTLFEFGVGINTGMATVGFMGSDTHASNYTVFGREVNIASRLEGISGRSRILISEACYERLLQDDSHMAALCTDLGSTAVKGIAKPVHIYEVPWQPGVIQSVPQ